MARCESGIEKVRRDTIPLEALVQDAWRPFAVRAERKSLAVQIDLPTLRSLKATDHCCG
jgi:hypothetical protein